MLVCRGRSSFPGDCPVHEYDCLNNTPVMVWNECQLLTLPLYMKPKFLASRHDYIVMLNNYPNYPMTIVVLSKYQHQLMAM